MDSVKFEFMLFFFYLNIMKYLSSLIIKKLFYFFYKRQNT